MRKICYFITDLAQGGAQTLLLDIIDSADDIEFTICHFGMDDTLQEKFSAKGCRVESLRISSRFQFPLLIWRASDFFHRNKFNIVHAHLIHAIVVGRIVGQIVDIPNLVTTHHNVPDNYPHFEYRLEELTRPLDTATVTVSKGVQNSLETGSSTTNQDIYNIPNGLDVNEFNQQVAEADVDQIRDKFQIEEDALTFLNIARYVPEKRQEDLIIAMEEILEEGMECHLMIVGWGDLEGELRQKVISRGLEDNVHITGHVPTVQEYYKCADVFVLPSIREGLPMTLIEAMAAELPIIGTRIPGVDEVVRDGENGYLVTPESPSELGKAMRKMGDEQRRTEFSQSSFEIAKNEFSIDTNINAYKELYEMILEGDSL